MNGGGLVRCRVMLPESFDATMIPASASRRMPGAFNEAATEFVRAASKRNALP